MPKHSQNKLYLHTQLTHYVIAHTIKYKFTQIEAKIISGNQFDVVLFSLNMDTVCYVCNIYTTLLLFIVSVSNTLFPF